MTSDPLNPLHAPSGTKVKRFSKVPLIAAGVGGAIIAVVIGYGIEQRHERQLQDQKKTKDEKAVEAASRTDVLTDTGTTPNLPAKSASTPPADAPQPAFETPLAPPGSQVEDLAEQHRRAAWTAYFQQLDELTKAKADARKAALTADITPQQGGAADLPTQAQSQQAQTQSVPGVAGPPIYGSIGGYQGVPGYGGLGGQPIIAGGINSRAQLEKQSFLADRNVNVDNTLHAPILNPPSPYVIMQGTAIPAAMIGGINSDIPSKTIVAQVTQNVYDTATGAWLLIPAGTKAIGEYNNQVSQGQTRIAVIWKRLIFPDTTSINLGTFEGQDQGGYAGFHDQVNTHFWQKLGDALLLSIAGAAVQLSQPQNNSNNGYNSQQVAAAQLGQQFAQLGQAYAMAGLSIPNTLVIRPGYSFIIMAAKDVPLRPYVDRRDTVANFGPVLVR